MKNYMSLLNETVALAWTYVEMKNYVVLKRAIYFLTEIHRKRRPVKIVNNM